MQYHPAGDSLIARRFEKRERIGAGGMGEVWRTYDHHLNREVALKQHSGGIPQDGDVAVERFRREAQLTARVLHPSIPAVYDHLIHEGSAYIVMQLVSGTTLRELLDSGKFFRIEQIITLAVQICDALSAVHRWNVIHRDLKPANMMLDENHHLWLLDFGIARSQNPADPALTRTDLRLGTENYASPEQRSAPGSITFSSDLYSLGCVIHELATGRPPVYRRNSPQPPRLGAMRSDVPPALEELVLSLLSENPADRPASAADVRADLMSIVLRDRAVEGLDSFAQTTVLRHGFGVQDDTWTGDNVRRMSSPPPDATVIRPTAVAPVEHMAPSARTKTFTTALRDRTQPTLAELQERAREAGERLGPGSSECIDLRLLIADSLLAMNDFRAAEECLRGLRRDHGAGFGFRSADQDRSLDIQHMLGVALHAQGNPEGASLLRDTADTLARTHGEDDPEVRSIRRMLSSSGWA